jgi:hypothetical protein
VAETPESEPDPTLDSAKRHVGPFRDLAMAQPVKERQLDRVALWQRERRQCRA